MSEGSSVHNQSDPNQDGGSSKRIARVRYDSFKNITIDETEMKKNQKKPGKIASVLLSIFTCNRCCKGVNNNQIKPQKKVRTSLNNSEINSFIQSRDNARQSNPNIGILSINTQQQTPNMEKRELERQGSVSSEEEKKTNNAPLDPLIQGEFKKTKMTLKEKRQKKIENNEIDEEDETKVENSSNICQNKDSDKTTKDNKGIKPSKLESMNSDKKAPNDTPFLTKRPQGKLKTIEESMKNILQNNENVDESGSNNHSFGKIKFQSEGRDSLLKLQAAGLGDHIAPSHKF
ncbi:unnamed protein product [Moneuplotes crassus]|uniref:Uncharacterized protein n=1 Tax=Euplotes crassus TaxID=5936 RepID=A0AAD1XGV0_EUPCR|nr:unnamed protein product [Moneuplotes crassus]